MSFRLWIPVLPDLDLSANRRRSRHYMAQARDTATERERAMAELAIAMSHVKQVTPITGPVSLWWTLHWPKGTRARDADGCADLLKAWIDAMKDLGWIANDSPRYVRWVAYEPVPSSPRGPGMELVIEPVEE